jgi:hypothetical protein
MRSQTVRYFSYSDDDILYIELKNNFSTTCGKIRGDMKKVTTKEECDSIFTTLNIMGSCCQNEIKSISNRRSELIKKCNNISKKNSSSEQVASINKPINNDYKVLSGKIFCCYNQLQIIGTINKEINDLINDMTDICNTFDNFIL